MAAEKWYELLEKLIEQSGLSRPQIEERTGVPSTTIASWVRGQVQSPREWQQLVRVLHAVRATREEADQILQGAGQSPVRILLQRAKGEELELLRALQEATAPFMAPDRPAATLYGRETELEKAGQALRRSRRAIVLGMGGVGKTTLAIELAHELQIHYPDGVFWGDMRVSTADAVLESWGQVCGVDLGRLSDFHSRAGHMRGVFSQMRALIILDDVIQTQEARQMIPSSNSACTVLITTRTAEVASALAIDDHAQIITLEPLLRDHSLAFFSGVLGNETLSMDPESADQVAEMMGDLPLALEICAALCADAGLTLANVASLLGELRTRLEWLRRDQKPVVRLAFEQSWELLPEDLRRALATLAVFEGRSFTAPAFAASHNISAEMAPFLLGRLRRRSLLNAPQAGHYQQHILLAAYATEKLADDGDAWRRFAAYYHALATERREQALAPEEWGNVMAGMGAAYRLEEWPLVLDYYDALHEAWRRQAMYTYAREGCAWAAEAAAQGDHDAKREAEILLAWGVACLEQADYAPARAHLEQALALFLKLAEHGRSGDAYYHLARVELARDNFGAAETAIQNAWQAYQQAEDLRGMGRALYRLGNITYHRGDYQRAIALAQDALRTQTDAEDEIGLLRAHMLAASAHLQLGAVSAADNHCRQAALLSEKLGDQAETAVFYYTYADLCRHQALFAAAKENAQKALALFREMMDTFSEANTLNLLAGIEVYWNDADPQRRAFEQGFGYCAEGLRLCELLDYSLGQAFLLLNRGRLLAQDGDFPAACTAWQNAQTLAAALQHAWLQNRLQDLVGEMDCA